MCQNSRNWKYFWPYQYKKNLSSVVARNNFSHFVCIWVSYHSTVFVQYFESGAGEKGRTYNIAKGHRTRSTNVILVNSMSFGNKQFLAGNAKCSSATSLCMMCHNESPDTTQKSLAKTKRVIPVHAHWGHMFPVMKLMASYTCSRCSGGWWLHGTGFCPCSFWKQMLLAWIKSWSHCAWQR